MPDRYPGYDVLSKRNTPSWNEQTRRVIDRRLAHRRASASLLLRRRNGARLRALCDRIVPQPAERRGRFRSRRWSTDKMHQRTCGTAIATPSCRRCRRRGGAALAALDAEARGAHGAAFHALAPRQQDALLRACSKGA